MDEEGVINGPVEAHGVLRSHSVVAITAINTSTPIYQRTTTDGNRTFKLRKALICNRSGAQAQVTFGETVAAVWTPRLPPLIVPNNSTVVFMKRELPNFEFTSDLIGRSDQAGADPADVRIVVEVEEIG